ncbi:MAG: acyl CoA:acetate/3-ketoacid CoA transferase, partial [Syntrophaceae bacterium]|nr:acyl CoA:acetate/3-ketoacid CoA transferase [Syntrophaceae bacterium]
MNSNSEINPTIAYIKAKMKRGKIVSAEDAVRVIRDGDTIALDGFVGCLIPEELIIGLEKRFLSTGEPRNLTLVYASGLGDGKDQ